MNCQTNCSIYLRMSIPCSLAETPHPRAVPRPTPSTPERQHLALYFRAVINEPLVDAVYLASMSPEHANAFSRPAVVRVAFYRRQHHTLHALDKSDVAVSASR